MKKQPHAIRGRNIPKSALASFPAAGTAEQQTVRPRPPCRHLFCCGLPLSGDGQTKSRANGSVPDRLFPAGVPLKPPAGQEACRNSYRCTP